MDVIGIVSEVEKITLLVNHFLSIDPTHWKGNDAPDPNHWDSIDKIDGGVTVEDKRGWIQFTFTEAAVQHTVKATFRLDQPGTPGGADEILLDGAAVEHADFIIGARFGLEGFHFYHRAVLEFKFAALDGTPHNYRFDGDVG